MMTYRLVETHIFSFVVGRAFVTDIEKLKISSKTRSLDVAQVLKFFSEAAKVDLRFLFSYLVIILLTIVFLSSNLLTFWQDGVSPGSNLLSAVEILVSGVCLFKIFLR